MDALTKGRTSFVIAQCLSAIRDADTIIYMRDGDIKETVRFGTETRIQLDYNRSRMLFADIFCVNCCH